MSDGGGYAGATLVTGTRFKTEHRGPFHCGSHLHRLLLSVLLLLPVLLLPPHTPFKLQSASVVQVEVDGGGGRSRSPLHYACRNVLRVLVWGQRAVGCRRLKAAAVLPPDAPIMFVTSKRHEKCQYDTGFREEDADG